MVDSDIRTLILDFDGTLGDTRQLIVKTLRETMEVVGLHPASEESCAATIGLPLKKCFQILTMRDETFAERCTDIYVEELFPINSSDFVVRPFPHVVETVETFQQKGLHLAIASSRRKFSVVKLLTQMGLKQCFPIIVGPMEVPYPKPAPDMVLEILRQTATPKEEVLVVGDTAFDIEMGRNAGCQTCGVTYGNGSRQSLIDACADFVIDDFKELLDML